MKLPLCISVARRLVHHEPKLIHGLQLAAATLYLWTRTRVDRSGRPVRVHISAPNGSWAYLKLWTYIDMLVVREVFLEQDYRIPATSEINTILDLGANTGVSVAYLRALYPDATIIAVEPEPLLFQRLRENVDRRVQVVQAAVAESDGTAMFFAARHGWYSSLERPTESPSTRIAVRTVTVDQLLSDAGLERVDLIKIDIEGGEWPLLSGGHIQAATNCIVGELHGGADIEERAGQAFRGWELTIHEHRGSGATFTARREAD